MTEDPLAVIRKSPIRLIRSGYGYLISNIAAVKPTCEYNEVAASMALMSGQLLLKEADKLEFNNPNM